MERRLSAVFAADMVGYTRLMEADEVGTLKRQKTHRRELIDPAFSEHHGRIVKTTGDGLLAEFPSVVDAVQCAVSIQRAMVEREANVEEEQRIQYRIGINLGDVIFDDDNDIYGDGVNVAARLEQLAQPGGICISGTTFDHLKSQVEVGYEPLGEVQVKNISQPVRAYKVIIDAAQYGVSATNARSRLVPASAALIGFFFLLALGTGGWWWSQQPDPERADFENLAFDAPNRPSIAVLPFANMGGDPEQEYFADGITEDLIIDLSRVSGLFVIARNSTFTYKGTPVKTQQIGRELGVEYVLEGSVRKSGSKVRINSLLVNAKTGRHLWADRYDRELTDVFTLQDEVVQKIVSALAIELTAGEETQLQSAAKADPEAYDLLLRGLEQVRRYTPETNTEARAYFERAIAQDPNYARAYASLAWTYAMDALYDWVDKPDEAIATAQKIAKDALEMDPSVRQIHLTLANTYLSDKRLEKSIAAARRALKVDPNYADAYAQLALSLNYAGRPEQGLEAIKRAISLDPRETFIFVRIRGQAYYLMGQLEAAIEDFERVVERNPAESRARLLLAAAYAQAGRIEDAKWEVQEALTLAPHFKLTQVWRREPYKNSGVLERFVEDLRKSGLPE